MSITIYMPALSPTMEMGNIVKWHKAEGDQISSGDIIAEIETDKAVMEFESADEGVLGKILIAEGSVDVKVNEPIAIILESENDSIEDLDTSNNKNMEATYDNKNSIINKEVGEDAVRELVNEIDTTEADIDDGNRIFISPIAKRIAEDKGIDLTDIRGTGPNGRILKKDVEAHKPEINVSAQTNVGVNLKLESGVSLESGVRLEDSGPSIKADEINEDNILNYTVTQIDTMRSVIAERLQQSNSTIPSYTLNIDASIKKLNEVRKK